MKKILYITLCTISLQAEQYEDISLFELMRMPITSVSEFSHTALDVPSSVTVLRPSDWEKIGARTPSEALSRTGAIMHYNIPALGETIKIRGNADLVPRGVATIIDGVPMNNYEFGTAATSLNLIGLNGIEKIELTRGPGSVLYGSDAFQGVKSFQTQVGYTEQNNVMVEAGSKDYYSAGLSSTYLTDNHIIDFALQASKQGNQERDFNYLDRTSSAYKANKRALESNYYNGFAKIRSNIDSLWRYEAGVYLFGSDASDMPGLGNFFSNLGKDDRFDHYSEIEMARTELSYSGLIGYEIVFRGFAWQDDSTVFRHVAPNFIQNRKVKENRSGMTLLIKSTERVKNTNWTLSTGLDEANIKYAHTKFLNDSGDIIRETDEAYNHKRRKIKNISFEAETLLNGFTLDYGLRLDDYNSFGRHISPRIGASYAYNDHSAIKLLYGQAFRAANAFEQTGGTELGGSAENIDPATIDTYELVFMTFQDNYKIEAVVFKSFWKDAIDITKGMLVNSEKRSHGVELNINYLQKPWRVDYSASYVKSENITKNEDSVDYPEFIHNLSIGYDIERLPINLYWSNRILTNMQQKVVGAPAYDIEKFWQSDLHAKYSVNKSMDISLNIQNIFDRKNYIPSLQFADEPFQTEPFNVALVVNYKF